MEIYQPEEDSFFFQDFLNDYFKKNNVKSYLDMGTGSGILSEEASKFLKKENILAADINKKAVELVKKKGFTVLQSNLFSKISKDRKFDLITFNAPYLPDDAEEPKKSKNITTGGKNGDEIALKFLKQAENHLTKEGKIFLLVSSLTPMGKINNFNPRLVARKNLFMEELFILEFNA